MSEKMRALSAEEYLEISRDEVRSTVERVMKEFDFEKAARALKGCRWRFHGALSSPSVKQLKETARKLLMGVIESGSGSTHGQGPLEAHAYHYETPAVVTVELSLKPVWKSAAYVDGRVIFAKKQRSFTGVKKSPS